jgi:hypothetical protein
MKRLTDIGQGNPTGDPLEKYNKQLSALSRREADKLLKIPARKRIHTIADGPTR